MTSAAHGVAHHLRVGLLGAFVFALLFALLWTTTALGALPGARGALVETFGPNQGVLMLIEGLFWSALVGGVVFSILSIVYGFARNSVRRG